MADVKDGRLPGDADADEALCQVRGRRPQADALRHVAVAGVAVVGCGSRRRRLPAVRVVLAGRVCHHLTRRQAQPPWPALLSHYRAARPTSQVKRSGRARTRERAQETAAYIVGGVRVQAAKGAGVAIRRGVVDETEGRPRHLLGKRGLVQAVVAANVDGLRHLWKVRPHRTTPHHTTPLKAWFRAARCSGDAVGKPGRTSNVGLGRAEARVGAEVLVQAASERASEAVSPGGGRGDPRARGCKGRTWTAGMWPRSQRR